MILEGMLFNKLCANGYYISNLPLLGISFVILYLLLNRDYLYMIIFRKFCIPRTFAVYFIDKSGFIHFVF